MKIGILGAGHIAEKMALTLTGMDPSMKYAVASRDISKARAFADKWGFGKAYGSYKDMVDDPEIGLIYVATPHSHHFEHASLCIEAGKPVLCEKSFTANARQADMLLNLAHKKGVFISEAIWTRFLPLYAKIGELLKDGVIGQPQMLDASLCYPVEYKDRLRLPELCGGALLDLGVYAIHFARMFFGTDVVSQKTSCVKSAEGIDMQEFISWTYSDGRMANLQASARCRCGRIGQISGSEGYILVDNINCPESVTVYKNYQPVATYPKPDPKYTGFEYEVLASIDAIRSGALETPFIPHQETLEVMKTMDSLRRDWGVVFPMD